MIDERAKKIIDDWCKKTKLNVEFTDKGLKIHPKLERKGAYVKELSELDNNLPIVNKAIVDYLTKGVLPEDTIGKCDDLKQFQNIVKISSNYKYGWHNGHYLTDKTFRVFASTYQNDTKILKCKYLMGEIVNQDGRKYMGEKFADTPEHCFIWNDEVNGVAVVKNLDKKWYSDLAEKRIADFGIDLSTNSLF